MTKAASKERRLNELYFDCCRRSLHLTTKGRIGGSTTVNHIRNAYRKRELGTLLRRLDPISFNCE